MIQAPTVDIFNNSESVEVESSQNQKYKLIISSNSKHIQFEIEDLISFPKNEYVLLSTLEELQKINRYFLFFKDTQEASKILIKSAKDKYLFITSENNKCYMKIINQINNEEFALEVHKKQRSLKEEIESYTPLIADMKKRIEILEKENMDLKQKNINLEEKVKDIEKRLISLENKNGKEIEEKEINKRLFKSNVINGNEEKTIIGWIPNRLESAELIFDSSRDGDTINAFKNKCQGKSPTLIIIKTNTWEIFGGYATSEWRKEGPIEDYNSFIFSFNPDKKYKVKNNKSALFGFRDNVIMFQFGCCAFRIANNCVNDNKNYISSNANLYYEDGIIDIIKGDNNKNKYFKVNRLEIFRLYF